MALKAPGAASCTVEKAKGDSMMEVHCRDLGFDCDEVVRADTEGEVMDMVMAHASADHEMTETAEEMMKKVHMAMHEAH